MVDRLPLIRLVEHMFSPEELSTLLSGFGGNGFVNHLPSPHPFHVYVHQVIERVEQLNLQVGFVRWLLKQRPTRVAEICLVAFRCFPGDDVDDLVRQVFSPSILATKNRPTSSYRVVVYWHINSDFGAVAAERYAAILQAAGLQVSIGQHRSPEPPDAIHIGCLIPAEVARTCLIPLPYTPKYIFRPDYPTPEGGDGTGMTIGVGYDASHFARGRGALSQPVPISERDYETLLERDVNNTEFQRRLRDLTRFQSRA